MDFFPENAFTINRLGGAFFPLSVKFARLGEVFSASFCAIRLIDLCDLIETYAQARLVLFGVDQSTFYDESQNCFVALARIAAGAGVPHAALDADTLLLDRQSLKPLLRTFNHSGCYLFDAGPACQETEIIQQVITCGAFPWASGEALLPQLPASRCFLTSHDDCYLTVETTHPAFLQAIFARLLKIYTQTILAENGISPLDIPEIPQALIQEFWQDHFGLCILPEAVRLEGSGLTLNAAPQPFDFSQECEYRPCWAFRYHWQNRQWDFIPLQGSKT